MHPEKMTRHKAQSSRKIPNPNPQSPGGHKLCLGRLGIRAWSFSGVLGFELGCLLIVGCITEKSSAPPSAVALSYPASRKTNTVDDYNGVKVADPYRWLEDDNAPETRTWVEAQNKLTVSYLQQIPELPAIQIGRASCRERV